MASPPLRIAILEADVPLDQARARYGSYGGIFAALLYAAADAAAVPRARLRITGWDVVNEGAAEGAEEDMGGEWGWTRRKGYPGLEEVDAVLITGSRRFGGFFFFVAVVWCAVLWIGGAGWRGWGVTD